MKICVIGTGTMAKGIVKAFAAKMPVVMKSRTQASLDKAMASISKGYAKLVEKGKIAQEAMDAMLANISTTTDYATFADADLVIEAAVEDMQLKKDVFTELDGICKPETVFATNSSSLSITEIAACTKRPAQFIGMHFFNPADRMALVEVIRGQLTSDEVCKCVIDLAASIGKQPVEVKEAPGFVVNRILIPMINEAVGILADGIATAAGARRPDRQRRQPRHHGGALQGIRRSEVPPASAAPQDGPRRPARPQDRRRLLQVLIDNKQAIRYGFQS